jgi:hypothetical protein
LKHRAHTADPQRMLENVATSVGAPFADKPGVTTEPGDPDDGIAGRAARHDGIFFSRLFQHTLYTRHIHKGHSTFRSAGLPQKLLGLLKKNVDKGGTDGGEGYSGTGPAGKNGRVIA